MGSKILNPNRCFRFFLLFFSYMLLSSNLDIQSLTDICHLLSHLLLWHERDTDGNVSSWGWGPVLRRDRRRRPCSVTGSRTWLRSSLCARLHAAEPEKKCVTLLSFQALIVFPINRFMHVTNAHYDHLLFILIYWITLLIFKTGILFTSLVYILFFMSSGAQDKNNCHRPCRTRGQRVIISGFEAPSGVWFR